jgi:hypothetical protein
VGQPSTPFDGLDTGWMNSKLNQTRGVLQREKNVSLSIAGAQTRPSAIGQLLRKSDCLELA